MKVNIFTRSANDPRFEVMLRQFGQGIQACGEEVQIVNSYNYQECDVAVIFGSWKDRPHDHHVVKRDVVKRAKNFIVLVESFMQYLY
jgi:multimeric flavodoxin WrbA